MKEALALPHRGVGGMPRKAVWSAMDRSESWYSLILDPEKNDLPNVVDFRKIVTITGNAEPLRVLDRWSGEGQGLAETDPQRLLTSSIEIDGLFTGQLAKALEDGRVTPSEARGLAHSAGARLLQAQQTFDALKKLAGRR